MSTEGKKGAGSELDKQIGGRLRALRVAKGWSQEKLGDELGLTFQQVQKYEKGTNRISGSRILKVCSLLGTTPNVLLTGSADGIVLSEPSTLSTTMDRCTGALGNSAQAFYEAVAAIPLRQRNALVNMATAIMEGA